MIANLRVYFPQKLRLKLFQNQKESPGTDWDETTWVFLRVKAIGT